MNAPSRAADRHLPTPPMTMRMTLPPIAHLITPPDDVHRASKQHTMYVPAEQQQQQQHYHHHHHQQQPQHHYHPVPPSASSSSSTTTTTTATAMSQTMSVVHPQSQSQLQTLPVPAPAPAPPAAAAAAAPTYVVDWLDFTRTRSAHFIAEKTCEMICYLWFATPSTPAPTASPNASPTSTVPVFGNGSSSSANGVRGTGGVAMETPPPTPPLGGLRVPPVNGGSNAVGETLFASPAMSPDPKRPSTTSTPLTSTPSVSATKRPHTSISTPSSAPSTLQLRASPTFVAFMQKLLETTQVSQSVIVLSLHYIYRLKEKNRYTPAQPGSEFRIGVAGLMMGNKFLDDNTYTNKTWSDVSGIELSEINRMEREFLLGVEFNLYVDHSTYAAWLNLLKGLVRAKERDCRNAVGANSLREKERERERRAARMGRTGAGPQKTYTTANVNASSAATSTSSNAFANTNNSTTSGAYNAGSTAYSSNNYEYGYTSQRPVYQRARSTSPTLRVSTSASSSVFTSSAASSSTSSSSATSTSTTMFGSSRTGAVYLPYTQPQTHYSQQSTSAAVATAYVQDPPALEVYAPQPQSQVQAHVYHPTQSQSQAQAQSQVYLAPQPVPVSTIVPMSSLSATPTRVVQGQAYTPYATYPSGTSSAHTSPSPAPAAASNSSTIHANANANQTHNANPPIHIITTTLPRIGSKRTADAAFSPVSASFGSAGTGHGSAAEEDCAKVKRMLRIPIPEYSSVSILGHGQGQESSPLEGLGSFERMSLVHGAGEQQQQQTHTPNLNQSQQQQEQGRYVYAHQERVQPKTLSSGYDYRSAYQVSSSSSSSAAAGGVNGGTGPRNLYFYTLACSPLKPEPESEQEERRKAGGNPYPPLEDADADMEMQRTPPSPTSAGGAGGGADRQLKKPPPVEDGAGYGYRKARLRYHQPVRAAGAPYAYADLNARGVGVGVQQQQQAYPSYQQYSSQPQLQNQYQQQPQQTTQQQQQQQYASYAPQQHQYGYAPRVVQSAATSPAGYAFSAGAGAGGPGVRGLPHFRDDVWARPPQPAWSEGVRKDEGANGVASEGSDSASGSEGEEMSGVEDGDVSSEEDVEGSDGEEEEDKEMVYAVEAYTTSPVGQLQGRNVYDQRRQVAYHHQQQLQKNPQTPPQHHRSQHNYHHNYPANGTTNSSNLTTTTPTVTTTTTERTPPSARIPSAPFANAGPPGVIMQFYDGSPLRGGPFGSGLGSGAGGVGAGAQASAYAAPQVYSHHQQTVGYAAYNASANAYAPPPLSSSVGGRYAHQQVQQQMLHPYGWSASVPPPLPVPVHGYEGAYAHAYGR